MNIGPKELQRTTRTKEDFNVDPATRFAVLASLVEERHVTVHCSYKIGKGSKCIRIAKSTYLKDCHSFYRAKLIHVIGIPLAPNGWMYVLSNTTARFTLLFSGLPKRVQAFHLIESTNDPYPFIAEGVERNNTDVYRLDLSL